MTTRPVEVDTALEALWEAAFDLRRTLGWKLEALHKASGERAERDPRTWTYRWKSTPEEAEAAVEALAAGAPVDYPDQYDQAVWAAMAAAKVLAEYRVALAAVVANHAAQEPLQAEYLRERWSRFFLVLNADGHIHRDMECSTCRRDTRYGWLPTLSGLTEADAVAQEGTRLCSVCYPTAPVEWTVGLPKAVDPNRCPGSGQAPRTVKRDVQYRQRDNRTGEVRTVPGTVVDTFCPSCGKAAIVNERAGDVRAHKLPKPKKGSRS